MNHVSSIEGLFNSTTIDEVVHGPRQGNGDSTPHGGGPQFQGIYQALHSFIEIKVSI